MTDPVQQRKTGRLKYRRLFFAYLDTKTKVNKKLQQPNPSRVIKSSDPSGMKAKVTPPDKEPRLTETPDGSRGNAERVEEGGYKYQ